MTRSLTCIAVFFLCLTVASASNIRPTALAAKASTYLSRRHLQSESNTNQTDTACSVTCTLHGTCVNATCVCDAGWNGTDCSEFSGCPNNCTSHGSCNSTLGECVCDAGWNGTDCSEFSGHNCPNNCSDHGNCLSGTCNCNGGWAGDDCSELVNIPCPNDCSFRGFCHGNNGTCSCDLGWGSDDCSEEIDVPCPANCNGQGLCNTRNGTCECDPAWAGKDCSTAVPLPCPNDCSGHGECDERDGICRCEDGWAPMDCSVREKQPCPEDCNYHGKCMGNGTCQCEDPWFGDTCKNKCELRCSGHGDCKPSGSAQMCECDIGYKGDDCALAIPVELVLPNEIIVAGEVFAIGFSVEGHNLSEVEGTVAVFNRDCEVATCLSQSIDVVAGHPVKVNLTEGNYEIRFDWTGGDGSLNFTPLTVVPNKLGEQDLVFTFVIQGLPTPLTREDAEDWAAIVQGSLEAKSVIPVYFTQYELSLKIKCTATQIQKLPKKLLDTPLSEFRWEWVNQDDAKCDCDQGTCVGTTGSYICQCNEGYSGVRCDTEKECTGFECRQFDNDGSIEVEPLWYNPSLPIKMPGWVRLIVVGIITFIAAFSFVCCAMTLKNYLHKRKNIKYSELNTAKQEMKRIRMENELQPIYSGTSPIIGGETPKINRYLDYDNMEVGRMEL